MFGSLKICLFLLSTLVVLYGSAILLFSTPNCHPWSKAVRGLNFGHLDHDGL